MRFDLHPQFIHRHQFGLRKVRILAAMTGTVMGLMGAGCHAPCSDAVCHLDRVAQSLDRYGFASISTAFLTGATDAFQFDLDKSASAYFDLAAKPQGGFRHSSAVATDVQMAARANIEEALITLSKLKTAQSLTDFRVAKAQAATAQASLEAVTAANPSLQANPMVASLIGVLAAEAAAPEPTLPEIAPSTSGPPPAGPPFDPAKRSALNAVGSTFTPSLAMSEGPFQISARDALLSASGDHMTQGLLKWFTLPAGNKLRNHELFFCPMVVSVQPGWETRENFGVDITVNVDLANQTTDGSLEFLSSKFPHSSPPIQVAGVFPIIDAQVLDLVNSRRQLSAMALQLSLLGFGSQADFFLDYAKKLESDAKTATALTAASAYTTGGSAFGFRVEPKLVASKDPTLAETMPGKLLESKAFPAMAVLLIDRRFLLDEPANQDAPCTLTASREKETEFRYLVLETSTRWIPLKKTGKRFTEQEALSRATALDQVLAQLNGPSNGTPSAQSLSVRARAMAKLIGDSRAIIEIRNSQAAAVCAKEIVPQEGWWDQYTVFTVHGQGFNGNVKAVTVGGIPCNYEIATDRRLLIGVPPWKDMNKKLPGKFGDYAAQLGPSLSNRLDALDARAKAGELMADEVVRIKEELTRAPIEIVTRHPISTPDALVVHFTRELPAAGGGGGPPKVLIEYDSSGGAIKSISTSGTFQDAAQLLTLVREQLRPSAECLKLDQMKVKIEGDAP